VCLLWLIYVNPDRNLNFVSAPSISSFHLFKFVLDVSIVEFLLNFFSNNTQIRANLRRSANVAAAAASSWLRVLKNQFFLSRLCACAKTIIGTCCSLKRCRSLFYSLYIYLEPLIPIFKNLFILSIYMWAYIIYWCKRLRGLTYST